MWECKKTRIRFHGKAPMSIYINKTATQEEMEADKNELIERIKYLKEKFLKFLRNENRKLYIYKIKDEDIDNQADEKICRLKQSLADLGGRNFDLLIVAQKSQKDKFKNISNSYKVRFVDYFSPDGDIVNKNYRKNGWNKIFDEFYPKLSLIAIKNKKYKFQ